MKPTSTGDLIPAVAEDYTVSDDRMTYTFTLREGVKFHNGETVTAEDVKYSIDRCADTSEGAPLVEAFSIIQAVEITDERTVTITISEPSNEFISYMTTAILPADYDQQDTAPWAPARSSLSPAPPRTPSFWRSSVNTGALPLIWTR